MCAPEGLYLEGRSEMVFCVTVTVSEFGGGALEGVIVAEFL